MTIPLPYPDVTTPDGRLDATGVQRNFETLTELVAPTGATTSASFSPEAGAYNKAAGIPHGLGRVPSAVVVNVLGAARSGYASNLTAATFDVHSVRFDGAAAVTETMFFSWVAVP